MLIRKRRPQFGKRRLQKQDVKPPEAERPAGHTVDDSISRNMEEGVKVV